MKPDTPRYFITRTNGDGSARHYWQPSARLAEAGWQTQRLSDDRAAAVSAAQAINARVDAARDAGGRPRRDGTLAHLARAYLASPDYAALAEETRRYYRHYIGQLVDWRGTDPVGAIDPPSAKALYRQHAGKPANARQLLTVLKLLYRWGLAEQPFARLIYVNPVQGFRMTTPAPRIRVASLAEETALVAAADKIGRPSVGDAVTVAAWTGQRPADVLALAMPLADEGRIRLRQSKTNAAVSLPAGPPLLERLAVIRRRTDALPLWLVTPERGRFDRYTPARFRAVYEQVRSHATAIAPSVADLRFQDFRDTAVTRLAMAAVDLPGICAITGHQLANAHRVLEHYLERNDDLADAAIAKLVEWHDEKSLAHS